MSKNDEQEIERLRANAEIRWNEMAKMTHEINWLRSDLNRYKALLNEAVDLSRDLLTDRFEVNNTGWGEVCWGRFMKLQEKITKNV